MHCVPSNATAAYNCVAHAIDYSDHVIWPDEERQFGWPEDIPRDERLATFQRFFENIGFVVCSSSALEIGWKKIAVYHRNGLVTHVARQLPAGTWTSKMGAGADGTHAFLHSKVSLFGEIGLVMRIDSRRPVKVPRLYPEPPLLINPFGGRLV